MTDTTDPLTPSDTKVIIAGIRQFGLAPDGSDLRDLEAAIERLTPTGEHREPTPDDEALVSAVVTQAIDERWPTYSVKWNKAILSVIKQAKKPLERALKSIAANTCCDRCQEAALVAQAALKETEE
jgi:hypothetical protein